MSDRVKDFVYDALQLPEWNAFDARTKEVRALRDAIFNHWKNGEGSDTWVIPNKLKIRNTTLDIDSIDSGFDHETTVTYKSLFDRPSEFIIRFNSKQMFFELLEQAGGEVVK